MRLITLTTRTFPPPVQCYQPAQVNLLHTLASSVKQGCVVILTGDYHYADIKVGGRICEDIKV